MSRHRAGAPKKSRSRHDDLNTSVNVSVGSLLRQHLAASRSLPGMISNTFRACIRNPNLSQHARDPLQPGFPARCRPSTCPAAFQSASIRHHQPLLQLLISGGAGVKSFAWPGSAATVPLLGPPASPVSCSTEPASPQECELLRQGPCGPGA